MKSPFFQKDAVSQIAETGFWAVKSTEIDVTKAICQVSIKVQKSTNQLCAMKLSDASGEIIVELKWYNDSLAEWVN